MERKRKVYEEQQRNRDTETGLGILEHLDAARTESGETDRHPGQPSNGKQSDVD